MGTGPHRPTCRFLQHMVQWHFENVNFKKLLEVFARLSPSFKILKRRTECATRQPATEQCSIWHSAKQVFKPKKLRTDPQNKKYSDEFKAPLAVACHTTLRTPPNRRHVVCSSYYNNTNGQANYFTMQASLGCGCIFYLGKCNGQTLPRGEKQESRRYPVDCQPQTVGVVSF